MFFLGGICLASEVYLVIYKRPKSFNWILARLVIEEQVQITTNAFDDCDDFSPLLEKVYLDFHCSDADYGERPYYEITELY